MATLKETFEDAIAVLSLPGKYRRRLRTTNMIERLIEETRRRGKVIRIFPNIDLAWQLIGAVLAKRHEEWSTGRRYLTMDEFYDWRDEHAAEGPSESEFDSTNHTLQPA